MRRVETNPTFTLTISGGDPDKLQDFGVHLLSLATAKVPDLRGEEE